jgi:hypothetical protein
MRLFSFSHEATVQSAGHGYSVLLPGTYEVAITSRS